MTYDELLEATKSPTYMNSRTLEHPYIIIRAIVELHKPFSDGNYQDCSNCYGVSYPCPTIQAIEKELG